MGGGEIGKFADRLSDAAEDDFAAFAAEDPEFRAGDFGAEDADQRAAKLAGELDVFADLGLILCDLSGLAHVEGVGSGEAYQIDAGLVHELADAGGVRRELRCERQMHLTFEAAKLDALIAVLAGFFDHGDEVPRGTGDTAEGEFHT